MHTIDVSDLPEPVARALAEQVEHLRRQLKARHPRGSRKPVAFVARKGTVYGKLTREEMYGDED